jgi:arylsulfatase A-like enzyme
VKGVGAMDEQGNAEGLVRAATRFSAERPHWVRPSYDGFGLVNLPWSILASLGGELEGQPVSPAIWPSELADGIEAVLLVIIDGLGYERLQRALAEGETPGLARLAREGILFPLTSVFPSTTVAALTTLATGCPPSQHGLLGFTVFLREFGMLSNLLLWSPLGRFPSYASLGLEPRSFLPVPTIAERAARAGIHATVVSPEAFRDTPLTKMQAAGAEFRGYRTPGEFVAQVHAALVRPGRQLVTAYWDTLDTLGHFVGPESAAWRIEFRQFDRLLADELLARLPRRNLLVVITADHGMVSLDPARQRPLTDPALLAELRVPPAGERRAVYLHPVTGAEESVRARLTALAGEDGWVSSRDELFAQGLFGPLPYHPEALHRVGELVLIAVEGAGFPWDPPGAAGRVFLGAHAGLEAVEQLVPCLIWRP